MRRLPEQTTSPTFPLPGRVQQTHQHSELPTQDLRGLERVTVGTGRSKEQQAEFNGSVEVVCTAASLQEGRGFLIWDCVAFCMFLLCLCWFLLQTKNMYVQVRRMFVRIVAFYYRFFFFKLGVQEEQVQEKLLLPSDVSLFVFTF